MCQALDPNLLEKLKAPILRELLFQENQWKALSPFLPNEPMQVLLLTPYLPDTSMEIDIITNLIKMSVISEFECVIIPTEKYVAVLLQGNHAIRKFEEQRRSYNQEPAIYHRSDPLINSFYITCGSVAETPKDLRQSFLMAEKLMHFRFFCQSKLHILTCEDYLDRSQLDYVITPILQEKTVARLLQYIQTFNRAFTAAALQELEESIVNSNHTPEEIRLFFADLYLQIKEQMKYLYQGYTIPFFSNSHIIESILNATTLRDITFFLVQRFDMIMSSIGASSRESVLDDILHYIQHNFTSNITLENIAPLFGYNHSYLGKIFHKKMGISFNEYLDRLRIERAMNLLLSDNTKVYVVSEQVGYKNVDYFHLKFRKYVNMSPMEYRKTYKSATNNQTK